MKCVLCDKEIKGMGHNPAPLRDKGRCCDECNGRVILARLSAVRDTAEGGRDR